MEYKYYKNKSYYFRVAGDGFPFYFVCLDIPNPPIRWRRTTYTWHTYKNYVLTNPITSSVDMYPLEVSQLEVLVVTGLTE
jgi:hypothetical protein